MATETVGLKELRERMEAYVREVQKGKSFLVMKRSKPLFKMVSADEDESVWEEVVDFTKLHKGGVELKNLLSRLVR